MKKKTVNTLVVAGGVVVIVVMLLLFTPAILGATSAGSDLEKYNGSSQQGNDTARIAGVVNTYLVGITGIPLTLVAYATALFVVVLAILWVLKKNRR